MDKSKIDQLFNRLSSRYDFICPFFSFGIDLWWRKKLISMIPHLPQISYLDIACGTGALINKMSEGRSGNFVGVDLSKEMLEIAKRKNIGSATFLCADAQALPFDSSTFDVTTNAFGLRNFPDHKKGISEGFRVLKNGGTALYLELGLPTNPLVVRFYRLYLHYFIPFIGRFIVNDPKSWNYLGNSIENFARDVNLAQELIDCGFKEVSTHSLTFGIAKIYRAIK